MGLFNLFKSKSNQEETNKKTEISDFFKININDIMSYSPKFVGSSERSGDKYVVKEYLLDLPCRELGIFDQLEINDVSKDHYNMIFNSHSSTLNNELISFINFCVDKFGVDMSGNGKIYGNPNHVSMMWPNGISIDNTLGHFTIMLHGIKKNPKDIEIETPYKPTKEIKKESIEQKPKDKLKFKGFYVEGNADEFASNLEKAGLKNKDDNLTSHFIFMDGTFLDRDCTIAVLYTPTERIVAKLIILFEEKYDWFSIKDEYNQIKELFKKKYSEDDSIETFIPPHYEGDGEEIEAIENGQCAYKTYLLAENGSIIIDIADSKQVCVSYEHTNNFKLYLQEKEKCQLDEI